MKLVVLKKILYWYNKQSNIQSYTNINSFIKYFFYDKKINLTFVLPKDNQKKEMLGKLLGKYNFNTLKVALRE